MFPKKSSMNSVCVFGDFLYNTIIILGPFENENHSILFCALTPQKCLMERYVDSQQTRERMKRDSQHCQHKLYIACTYHRFSYMPLFIPLRIIAILRDHNSKITIKTKLASTACRRHHLHGCKTDKQPRGDVSAIAVRMLMPLTPICTLDAIGQDIKNSDCPCLVPAPQFLKTVRWLVVNHLRARAHGSKSLSTRGWVDGFLTGWLVQRHLFCIPHVGQHARACGSHEGR